MMNGAEYTSVIITSNSKVTHLQEWLGYRKLYSVSC